MNAFSLDDIAFTRHEPDPDVCEDCGGMGEIIVGDGGTGVYGQYSDTGYTDRCTTCNGTGDIEPLIEVAREKLGLTPRREVSPADRSSSPCEEDAVLP